MLWPCAEKGETTLNSRNLSSVAMSQEHWVLSPKWKLSWVLRTANKFWNQCKNRHEMLWEESCLTCPKNTLYSIWYHRPQSQPWHQIWARLMSFVFWMWYTTWKTPPGHEKQVRWGYQVWLKHKQIFEMNHNHLGLQPQFSRQKKTNRQKLFVHSSPSEPAQALWKMTLSRTSLLDLLA